MSWIIKSNLPLHFCEDAETRRYTNLDRISQETLYHGLERSTRHVEAAIKADMPKRYGLIIDGWAFNSEHYLAVFVGFEKAGTVQYPLLPMAPLMNSPTDDRSAATHLTFLREILLYDYNKRVEDSSHRLNQAVQDFFREVSDDLDKVKSLIVNLKSLNQSAKLRPMLSQDTRWSSTYYMIHRYFRLLEFIKDDDELADNLPGPAANRRLRKFLEVLSKSLASHIGARAAIVHSPHFETACVKVLDGKTAELTSAETVFLRRFAVQREETSVAAAIDDAESSFVEQVKKRRKLATSGATKYELIHALLPTSNIVERFFRLAKATVGTQRQGLNPITLEMLPFLRVNSTYWNAQVANERM
ncbi:hypothetical protein F442_20720 [Phytophthora nicotianae P10297]|uniref:HAT C-terminal dimerisation domain-containing protein n=1 Tax=Phytophthora nicotianae P10297 TaxID=1317064 RepID=W2Y557_PHYNI|nr:hypothetical protein F442_20720 [Phytophthora nicotianae P10297]